MRRASDMASIATRTRSQLGREVQACGDTSTDSQGNPLYKYLGEVKGHQPPGWYIFFQSSHAEQCGPFESLDLAKSHAAEMMSGIADDASSEFGTKHPRGAENEGATRKANDATTGGGVSGSGGNTAADRVEVEVSHILLAMRSGSAGQERGASPPTEQDDLLSTWSVAAPAVFASLVSPEPEGDTTAELLELICQSGDSDDLLYAVYFGSPPPPQDRNHDPVQRETMSGSSDVVPGVTDPDPQGALEEGEGNPYGISADMLELCSGKVLEGNSAGSSATATASPATATTTSDMATTVAFPDGDMTLVDWKSFF